MSDGTGPQGRDNKTTKRSKKRSRFDIRLITQILFFGVIAAIAVSHSLAESGVTLPLLSTASTHAICPFGGVVSVYQYVTTGTLVKKVHESALALMYIGFALALFAGPAFCGWACPFGSFQEWLGKLGRKIFKKRYNQFVPSRIDKWLRYLRYVVLVWVVWVTAVSAVLVFEAYDPYYALFNFWGGEVALSAMVILGVVMALSLVVERPFCKYACPYGAVLGVFNLFRIFKVKRNAPTCIDCKACDRACPMNITVSTGETVRDHQCISCLKCTSEQQCPVEATVAMTTGKVS
jgi:Pyruvate/2-oxoacid:ferredoxin oxidoreductase delta subunit